MKYYFKCPKCGGDDGFTLPAERSSGVGCLLLVLGGFLAALLYADAQSNRVQCDNCGYIFRQPPLPKTGIAKLATAILLVLVAGFVAAMILIFTPDLDFTMPQPSLVEVLVVMMKGRAGALVIVTGATAAATVFICFLAAAASSLAQRRRLSKEFELRPKRKKAETNREQHAGPAPPEAAPGEPPEESST